VDEMSLFPKKKCLIAITAGVEEHAYTWRLESWWYNHFIWLKQYEHEIQGDLGGNVNILGGEGIGDCSYEHVSNSKWLPR
jgi:hypothetical protein